jgi:hypothetical protein
MGFFQFFCFFRVFLGFFRVSSIFRGFFRFLSGLSFFGFFLFRVWVRVTGAKIHPNSHPSGAKPADYPKLKPELSSLIPNVAARANLKNSRAQAHRSNSKGLCSIRSYDLHLAFVLVLVCCTFVYFTHLLAYLCIYSSSS